MRACLGQTKAPTHVEDLCWAKKYHPPPTDAHKSWCWCWRWGMPGWAGRNNHLWVLQQADGQSEAQYQPQHERTRCGGRFCKRLIGSPLLDYSTRWFTQRAVGGDRLSQVVPWNWTYLTWGVGAVRRQAEARLQHLAAHGKGQDWGQTMQAGPLPAGMHGIQGSESDDSSHLYCYPSLSPSFFPHP